MYYLLYYSLILRVAEGTEKCEKPNKIWRVRQDSNLQPSDPK